VLTFSLIYSATFLEGRLEGHSALYLDETEAYARTRNVNLNFAFTIACWIKLMPSESYYRAILRSEIQDPGFVFGVDNGNQLHFENAVSSMHYAYTAGILQEKQWFHVAVSFVQDTELSLFINGFKHPQTSMQGFPWQSPVSPFEIGRYVNSINTPPERYFHGYLSDLYIFGRALVSEDIGKLMGKNTVV